MNVLILHGIQGKAGENWGQWLADSLKQNGLTITMPTLPDANHPNRSKWLSTISEVIGSDSKEAIIVAHSLGVTSALDYIESHMIKGLVSVSGFAQDYELPLNSYFLQQRTIDFASVRDHLPVSYVFYGDDDPYVPQSVLHDLARALQVMPTVIPKGGHLNAASGYSTFPELRRAVLAIAAA